MSGDMPPARPLRWRSSRRGWSRSASAPHSSLRSSGIPGPSGSRKSWPSKFGEGLREISTHLGDLTARILRPFLADAAYRQAIAELFVALEAMIGKEEGITLEIFGPEDLLQPLRDKLSSKNIAAVFTPTETVDVRVIAGQTILETCHRHLDGKVEERLQ